MDNEIDNERFRLSARGLSAMDAPDERMVCTMTYGEMLEALRSALLVLHGDACRLPLATYRVMVALGEAGEPCSAYAVARRAGFLLEHGRVKLHEARRYGVVDSERVSGQGVLWVLTDKGREELERVMREIAKAKQRPEAVSPAKPRRRMTRRKKAE